MTFPPCVRVRVALTGPCCCGLIPCQFPFGQPAVFPPTVAAGAKLTVRSKTPRPLWSELPRSCEPDVVEGTGFWPGDGLLPLFTHVYRTVPLTTIVAMTGVLPKPVASPVAVKLPLEFCTKVGPDFQVKAATTLPAVRASTAMAVATENTDRRMFLLLIAYPRRGGYDAGGHSGGAAEERLAKEHPPSGPVPRAKRSGTTSAVWGAARLLCPGPRRWQPLRGPLTARPSQAEA